MAEVQRVVDEVRFRLQSGDCELTDELKRLAEQFAVLCRELNSRLRRCGEYLKRGLRAEAMHLAEAEPNLLELFATVDFPERVEWDEIIAMYSLPRPEPLLADVAEQLNEAYALQQPLEKLLERHRMLALSRSRIGSRLSVMRKLAELDEGAQFWDDDIRVFEKQRLGEIESEVKDAATRADGDRLQGLTDELSSAEWRQQPPAGLMQSARRATLQIIADDLATAYSTGNADRGRVLRDRWAELSSRTKLAKTDKLVAAVGPSLRWLSDEDARAGSARLFAEKLATIERRLANRDSSLEQLEAARREVTKMGRDVPEPLASRLYERILELQAAERIRRRRIIGVVGGTTAAVLALAILIGSSMLRADSARRIAAAAEDLVNQGNLGQARELLDQNSWMSNSVPYLAVHVKLVEAERKEAERAEEFRVALESARSAPNSQDAESELRKADHLARTSDEHRLVFDVNTDWQLKSQQVTAQKEKDLQELLGQTTDLIERVENLHRESPANADFAEMLKKADKSLSELRRVVEHDNPKFVGHVDSAESRLARIHNDLAHAEKRSVLLARMTKESYIPQFQADGDLQVRHFCADMRELIELFPNRPENDGFRASAAELDLWRGVIAWQKLAGRWRTLMPPTVADAKSRWKECSAWREEFAASPPAAAMLQYATFVRSVAAREQDDSGDEAEGLRRKLLRLFSGPLIDDVHMLESRGERYYVKGAFTAKNEKIALKYISGFRGESKTANITTGDLTNRTAVESPQLKFANRAEDILKRASLADWDAALQQIAELLCEDHEMDAFLRYYLLLRVFEFAKQGNSLLTMGIDAILTKVRNPQIDLTAHWMDPKDEKAKQARQLAQKGLLAIPPLRPLWEETTRLATELHDQLFEAAFPVGWSGRDGPATWRAQSNWKPAADHSIWVIFREEPGGPSRWERVGEADPQNGIVLKANAAPHLQEGRLLFARPINPPKQISAK